MLKPKGQTKYSSYHYSFGHRRHGFDLAAFLLSHNKNLNMKKALQFVLLSLFFQLSAAAQNVKITQNGLNPAIATQWENVATELGYNVSTVPRSILDDNSFFSTTDILIISGGTDSYTVAQLNVVKDFLASGKSVYLQGEYLTTYSNNQFFSQIIASYGDSFTWTGTVDGQLGGANMTIVGSLSYLNNSITSLPYFWYGATGISTSTRLIPFVYNGTQPLGWMYNPVNASYGRLILITDQDWIGNVGLYPAVANLMKNILYHLKNKTEGDMNYTTPVAPTNGIVYVKKGGTGWGKSWTGSLPELADALRAAKRNTNIKEIWVAGGTYKPLYSPEDGANFGTNKGSDNAFLMAKDVKIYGGFAGAETQLSQRDWRLNPTVLSGEIQDDANMTNNVYHVVIAAGDVGSATLDGFTVTQGAAYNGTANLTVNGASLEKRFAGGIYNSNSSPLIKNCIITNNSGYFASGFGSKDGSPVLVNTLISKNKNIYNSYSNAFSISSGSPKLINVSIVGNEGTFPILSSGAGELYNSIVWGNTVFGSAPSLSNMTIKNSFVQKEAVGGTGLGADPQFVDAATGNFSLQAGSPAIDAGDNSLYTGNLNTDKDLLGNPRLTGTQIDLGAYESLVQNQTITVSNIAKTYGDVAFEPGATASSGLTVTYVSADNSIAEAFQDAADANKWKLKIKKAGTVNITASQAGNGAFSPAPDVPFTLTIQPKALTVTATGNNKIYDATNTATVSLGSNALAGDDLTLAYTSATFNDKTVANGKPVSVSGISLSGTDAANYTFNTTAVTTANITPFALVVTTTGNNKIYDATNTATVNLSSNAFAGDAVTLAYTSATFNDKTVASGKAVSVSGISLSGTDAGNYTFNTAASTTANITPFALTVSATGNDKVYDATNNATVNLSSNAFAGDAVTLAYTSATFNEKTVASGKAVSVSGISLFGTDATNYTFNTTASTTANITPFALTVSATGNDKVYDATNNATVTLASNAFAGDAVTLAYTSATFNDKTVASGKTVSVSGISLSGTDAGDYTFNTAASTTANITPFALTVSATGNDKVYDATNNATVNLSSNTFAGDAVTLAYTSATFNDKTVASGKTVSVSGISLSGTDAGNYTFNTTASTMANVTPFALTISASANDKIYNGNADAAVTLSHNGFAGDVIALIYTAASFDNRNVGNGKPVSISGISLSGADAGNYTLGTTATTTAAITPATLNIVAQAKTKTYGDADPALTYIPTGLIGTDAIVGSLGRTAGENVNSYPITQGTLSAGTNYVLTFTGATLTINRATLTVTAANAARCFGQGNPNFTLNYSGFKLSDNENSLAIKPQGGTIATASSAAGNYPITVSGGTSANYTFVYVNGNLRIDALPTIAITPSRQGVIGKGLSLQLAATGGNNYSWANAQGIVSGQNSATLTIRPTTNTIYTVTVTNANGCSSTMSYAVTVADDLSILKATNLLSPNGDGVNDVWKVDNIDMYPQAVVRIFDKAGRIVYTKKGYDNTWDGTYNGQPLAENTYYYTIDLGGGRALRGYITLVRDR